jgi:histidinol dehydrogenase
MRRIVGFSEGLLALQRGPQDLLETTTPALEERSRTVFGKPLTPLQAVQQILEDVREDGDDALSRYTKVFDGADLQAFEVSKSEIELAYSKVSIDLMDALKLASVRIRRFHQACMRNTWNDADEGWGELVTALERVGVYVPGGTAVYPSTVLMTAIPARVSGVNEVIITTPPRKDGSIDPSILVASDIAGVDRVFKVGGAQAIGALAYGTESIPHVDLICGPGNLFVTIAKKLVFGSVAVDGLYGPTETDPNTSFLAIVTKRLPGPHIKST